MHEGDVFAVYQFLELVIKGGKVRVMLNGMAGGMVAVVALIFPYVDWDRSVLDPNQLPDGRDRPKVSQSPTSVRQLPTKCT